MTLPELPGATLFEDADMIGYTAEQMLALRAAAFMAGMERAAEIAREHCEDAHEAPFKDYENTHIDGYQDAANDIDEAIRSEIARIDSPDKLPPSANNGG